ncbi:MAG TPA: carbamoyltransferase HypF [Candidatus Acidoferrales bacterium]|nr:carbamoyltransferase HypF [Candidatus Acidoferrales bacterium]
MVLHGAVQGVGFRPFVYRLAAEMGLNGWVLNSSQGVFIEVEGEKNLLDQFVIRLEKEKPPRAYVQGIETSFLDPVGYESFEIKESNSDGEKSVLVLPDIATCPDCVREIFEPGNRRYLYPFTNCTNCGPRFSIIKSLPYDRPNTTMQKFEMCEECREEYENPGNRRFHAQPNACPKCGPHIELWDRNGGVLAAHHDALLQASEAIKVGKIVALKGIGGFQLLVDARNDEGVKLLRVRKHREEKPFALMYPSLGRLKQECEISEIEERLLLSPEAPIVLLKRMKQEMPQIAPSVAPRNPYLGAMLPYSPLHHILRRQLDFPLVATSGNISDEPICTDESEAIEKLKNIADFFLVHDRPVERHVDDSVVRVMAGRVQIVRRARGYAPFPIENENECRKVVLAVGGHLKNTVAMNSGNNIFLSQHIGDLSTQEALRAFEKVTGDFQKLYEISPKLIAHDMHPDYSSTHFAEKARGEKLRVQHHFAHVASCMAENKLEGDVLGVSWDGTGYGEDGTVWGGEFLLTDGAFYERIATLRSFRLPGSSASIKEPRRTAIGLLYEIFGDELFLMKDLEPIKAFDEGSLAILRQMLAKKLNSPVTTSAGRLFDSVSSIVGLRQVVNFEGQGAMELEFALDGVCSEETYHFELAGSRRQDSVVKKYYDPDFVIDWEPMIREIIFDESRTIPFGLISAKFHNTLVEMIVAVAEQAGREKVVLSGGCFQNKYLTERAVARLSEKGFKPYWHQRVPPNDGGISLGQIFVALNRSKRQGTRSQNQEIRSEELTAEN